MTTTMRKNLCKISGKLIEMTAGFIWAPLQQALKA
jgi:hypothetical protein